MTDPVRCFVAVNVRATRPLREFLDDLSALGRPIRTSDAEKLHVTLKFLGDVKSAQIPAISRAVEQVCQPIEAFDVLLRGTGVFPHRRRPSVVWVGMENADALVQMATSLEDALKALGFPRERREFQPHLTVGRIRGRPPTDLFPLLDLHETTEFGTVPVTSVEVMQSELSPSGSIYTPLSSVSLTQ